MALPKVNHPELFEPDPSGRPNHLLYPPTNTVYHVDSPTYQSVARRRPEAGWPNEDQNVSSTEGAVLMSAEEEALLTPPPSVMTAEEKAESERAKAELKARRGS